MEMKTIQEIEQAIDALPPQELAELYAWLDRHRTAALVNTDFSGGEAELVKRTSADLIAAIQRSPYRELEIEPERYRMPVRDVVL